MQNDLGEAATLRSGAFIRFMMTYLHAGNAGLGNEAQALAIEAAARVLLGQGYPVVAIIYSANEGQTRALAEAYGKGQFSAGIDGLHQAEVMAEQERDLGSDTASDLQMKLRIAPITTILGDSTDIAAVAKADLDLIERQLRQGWAILGWQNQDTLEKPAHPFAIGGGVATNLPDDVSAMIQERLIGFETTYPVPNGTLPSPWPPAISGDMDA